MFGPAEELELRPAHLTLRGAGSDRKRIISVRQSEAKTEAPIRTQLDRSPPDGELCAWLGGAVDHQFGIHVKPETLGFRPLGACWTRDADRSAGKHGQPELRGLNREEVRPPANKLRNLS